MFRSSSSRGPALGRGGLVVDDVQQSPGFAMFTTSVPAERSYVADADDHSALFGIALKAI